MTRKIVHRITHTSGASLAHAKRANAAATIMMAAAVRERGGADAQQARAHVVHPARRHAPQNSALVSGRFASICSPSHGCETSVNDA